MGAICALACADIFMDYFERKYIYPFLAGLSWSCLRIIDDISFIWASSKSLNDLNTEHNFIKFEF